MSLMWKSIVFLFQLLCNGPGTCVPLCYAAFISTVCVFILKQFRYLLDFYVPVCSKCSCRIV